MSNELPERPSAEWTPDDRTNARLALAALMISWGYNPLGSGVMKGQVMNWGYFLQLLETGTAEELEKTRERYLRDLKFKAEPETVLQPLFTPGPLPR